MKGMQKIKRGTGFRGVLDYAFDKDEGVKIGGNMNSIDARSLASEFKKSRELRPEIEKPVWHNSLRLPKSDSISHEKWCEIADEYMKKIGFSDLHQRAYVLHSDSDGEHIHIIASRISLDQRLYLGQNENLISTRIISELEKKHGIAVTKNLDYVEMPGGSFKVDMSKIDQSQHKRRPKAGEKGISERTGKAPEFMILQAHIDEAIAHTDNFDAFAQRLAQVGVSVLPAGKTGEPRGISFGLGDMAFKGSALGKGYAWEQIKKKTSYDSILDVTVIAKLREKNGNGGGINEQNRQHGASSENRSAEPSANGNRTGEANRAPGSRFSESDRRGQAVNQRYEIGDTGSAEGGSRDEVDDSSSRAEATSISAPVANPGYDSCNRGVLHDLRSVVDTVSDLAAVAAKDLPLDHQRKIDAWREQSNALDAPHYRITLIPRKDDLKAFNVGKGKAGEPERFFTASEVESKISLLRQKNASGYEIYITPIDAKHHFILIDDAKQDALQKLIDKGFKPALMQQSSKDNYQIILKATKAERKDEQSLVNTFMSQLNSKLGDPKINGAVHPFRMAGFLNRKDSKIDAESGMRPITRVLYADNVVCEKSSAILDKRRADADSLKQQKVAETKVIDVELVPRTIPQPQAESGAAKDYAQEVKKAEGLAKSKGWVVDYSKIDFAASKALLKQGRTIDEVEKAITQASPSITDRHQDPEDYARRTAEAAYRAISEPTPRPR